MFPPSASEAYESTDYEYHLPVYLDAPRGFRDPVRVAERLALLESAASVQALHDFAADLTRRRAAKEPYGLVPLFDPADSGVEARVLLLLEAPGPMTANHDGRPGSGFISVDNDDPTAENLWRLRDEFGLDNGVLLWNIVPWYLGPATVHPNAAQVAQGALELRRMMSLLNHLEVVLTCGVPATRGWQKHVSPHLRTGPTVIETWHPSPLAMAAPGKRDGLRKAFSRAAALVGAS